MKWDILVEVLAGNVTTHIHVDNYELMEVDGNHQLRVRGVTTSRVWINIVASAYLEGKAFDISDEYVKMLKAII